VPIILSLGIGVMRSQRAQEAAAAAAAAAAAGLPPPPPADEGGALDGFGIVSLASLLPILSVQCMCVWHNHAIISTVC
jgi:hypothetical protein